MALAAGAQIPGMTLLTEGFGRRLRELRLAAGETQHALAIAVGVREQAVSRWERGKGSLHARNLDALCKHYRVRAEWLLYGDAAHAAPTAEHPTLGQYLATAEGAALPSAAVQWLRGIRIDGNPSVFTWHHLAAAWKSQEGTP